MAENTKIEWATHSWSPWRGCTKVSSGCANCYAETLSKRNPAVLGQWGKGKPRVLAKNWGDPVRWDARAARLRQCPQGHRFQSNPVLDDGGFCPICDEPEASFAVTTVFPSLCDWLDEEIPTAWLARFLALIHETPDLTWLLLTKRPANFRQRLKAVRNWALQESNYNLHRFVHQWLDRADIPSPSNVWVGTSVEDQIWADARIPDLLDIPAAGRFLSVEPLLGPVDLTTISEDHVDAVDALRGYPRYDEGTFFKPAAKIDWVIAGGESGPRSRPCNVGWIRSLVDQCKVQDVPVFVKQLGKAPRKACGCVLIEDRGRCPDCFDGTQPVTIRDPKGGDPAEWPADLRVREFPKALGGAR
jgi:protein gp37